FDQFPTDATREEVTQLPTFQVGDTKIVGYLSKEDLVRRLDNIQLREETVEDKVLSPDSAIPFIVGPLVVPQQESIQDLSSEPADASSDESIIPAETAATATPPPNTPSISRDLPPSFPWITIAVQALRWTGLLSGTVATGGLLGVGLTVAGYVIRQRLRRRVRASSSINDTNATSERSLEPASVPFPRRLDEARQLLELRQSEGRVAVLDALRGMFLDDEIEKLTADHSSESAKLASQLRAAIDARVDEVAPLSTRG
ncbi:MAG: hypothetical protein KDA80_22785, partial [Planctomycetaceae bacterium]|nr:hypothetical protein [Planctomycetaceae bacterium]